MRQRLPLVPTLVVVLAVVAMLRLGWWQIERGREKATLLARYTANASRPVTPYAALWPIDERALFRRVSLFCLDATGWQALAGRTVDGQSGWRHLADCRTGAEGPGVLVDFGVSATAAPPHGAGGRITGRLTWAPSDQPLVAALFSRPPPPTPLVVSTQPAPGLAASAPPDPASVPNNHLSYAVQWFIFAFVAVTVYLLALRRRARQVSSRP